MSTDSDRDTRAASLAALSICETLALTLVEHSILSRDALRAALDDAIEAHKDAAASSSEPDLQLHAAQLAERIKASIEEGEAIPRSDAPDK